MVFWYLPTAFRFRSHARQYDRDAFDQAGFDDEGYPDDKGAFRRFIHMGSFEKLKDPRSRELASQIQLARSDRGIRHGSPKMKSVVESLNEAFALFGEGNAEPKFLLILSMTLDGTSID
jgi:hypothetical protein